MKPSKGRDGDAGGFTLLELAVVVFIMGLMLTLITPYVGGLRGTRLRSEVRRLAGRASYLYDKAASNKLVMRLTFDIDANRYFVSRLDPYALEPLFVPEIDPGGAPVTLPPGVRIRDVTVEGVGTISRGSVSCHFYPEGYVDATLIHLQDESGRTFTLEFDPLTGRVSAGRGYLAPAAVQQ